MLPLDTTAAVATPERVRFEYRLAGPGPRAVAWAVDSAIRAAILLALAVGVLVLSSAPALGGAGTGVLLVGLFLLEWWYGAIFETLLQGRTPGKWLVGIRVVRADGAPGRVSDFVLRNLLRGVDFLPGMYGIGVATMGLDDRMRRVGDLVAGTVVVREDRSAVLGPVAIDPPVSEEERRALPAAVALDREEIAVIEGLLRRRRSLSDQRVEELAALLGPVVAERTGIEAPTWERVLTLAYARATGRDREVNGGP